MHIHEADRSDILLPILLCGCIAPSSHQEIISLVSANHAAVGVTLVLQLLTVSDFLRRAKIFPLR